MKNSRPVLITSLFLLFIFSTVAYTACTKDNCKGVECQNGGGCDDGQCMCPDGYSGKYCEVKGPCVDVKCENGGVCQNGGCACKDGYTGDRCELEWRSLYYKTYVGNGTDNNGSQYKDFTMEVSKQGAALDAIKLRMWEPGAPVKDTLEFTVELNADGTFIIEPLKRKMITYTGNGKLTFTTATLTLLADIDAPPYHKVTMQFPVMTAK